MNDWDLLWRAGTAATLAVQILWLWSITRSIDGIRIRSDVSNGYLRELRRGTDEYGDWQRKTPIGVKVGYLTRATTECRSLKDGSTEFVIRVTQIPDAPPTFKRNEAVSSGGTIQPGEIGESSKDGKTSSP